MHIFFKELNRFLLNFNIYSAILRHVPSYNDRREANIVYQQRVVIVGAGIIGLSTAYALLRQGMEHVTVLEQAEVDHQRGTSHGTSRLLRFEYGSDLFYSEMVQLSLNRWKNLERLTRHILYTRTGLLVLGNEGDNYTKQSYHILRELGHSTERLSRSSCNQLFPQFYTDAFNFFTYNTNAGILHASTCLRTVRDAVLDLGGEICESCHVTHITKGNQLRPLRLRLRSGDEITADRAVLAIGPWVHRLLGDLQLPVRLTRQYLLYFAHLPPSSFALHTFPAFIASDLYGFPIHSTSTESGSSWFKAASHNFGSPADPDEIPPVDERVIAQVVEKLYDLLPALRQAELAQVDSCMYDVSPDEDFILDRHPDDPRVVFATGLTGHGFKFGLVLGELLSSLLCNTDPLVPMDHFRLARFAKCRKTRESSIA